MDMIVYFLLFFFDLFLHCSCGSDASYEGFFSFFLSSSYIVALFFFGEASIYEQVFQWLAYRMMIVFKMAKIQKLNIS